MLNFSDRGILLDIEGTTSAIAYVYDVMFPFARNGLDAYLDRHWGEPGLAKVGDQIASDAGHASLDAWLRDAPTGGGDAKALVRGEVVRLMDGDVKATGLKQLQGLIWEDGFRSGELRAHVFPDVPPALAAWREAGIDLRVYSSGSVHAQKLFFGHSDAPGGNAGGNGGDLLPFFSGHYDTTTGGKREPTSYTKIAGDWGLPAAGVLFLSDVVAELDAAREAGMQTGLVVREGNAPVEPGHGHAALTSFAEIELTPPA
ncbi:MAG: acireductone synthase [Planctomycetota bacterium]